MIDEGRLLMVGQQMVPQCEDWGGERLPTALMEIGLWPWVGVVEGIGEDGLHCVIKQNLYI